MYKAPYDDHVWGFLSLGRNEEAVINQAAAEIPTLTSLLPPYPRQDHGASKHDAELPLQLPLPLGGQGQFTALQPAYQPPLVQHMAEQAGT